MFQQKDYQVFELKDKLIEEYVIKPGDDLTLTFVTRDGEALIIIETNQTKLIKYTE
jgi:hypothetical protein